MPSQNYLLNLYKVVKTHEGTHSQLTENLLTHVIFRPWLKIYCLLTPDLQMQCSAKTIYATMVYYIAPLFHWLILNSVQP